MCILRGKVRQNRVGFRLVGFVSNSGQTLAESFRRTEFAVGFRVGATRRKHHMVSKCNQQIAVVNHARSLFDVAGRDVFRKGNNHRFRTGGLNLTGFNVFDQPFHIRREHLRTVAENLVFVGVQPIDFIAAFVAVMLMHVGHAVVIQKRIHVIRAGRNASIQAAKKYV
ncbi:hypothetical protein D3C80_1071210 [compost metagenome]